MTKGPDSPIVNEGDDRLGRRAIAGQIYSIVNNTFEKEMVRIGVFGKWGSGKTSVMNMLEKMAKKNDAVIVHFNPWSCTTEHELWFKFANAALNALKDARITFAYEAVIRAKIIATKGAGIIGRAAEAHAVTDAIARALGLLAEGKADLGKEDFEQISEALSGKRIVVVIDDLDRVNTDLVPRLLYGLQELLDLPGFCFVLGFDPEVVGKALGNEHPGWGDGLTFLEKIIDYPIWLPEPTDYQLRELLADELKKHDSTLKLEDFSGVFEELPRNPRSLKRFVRQLCLLNAEIQRHNAEEISLPLLIALNLFKVDWPLIAHDLLHDTDVLDKFLTAHRLGRLRDDKQGYEKLWEEAKTALKASLERYKLDDAQSDTIFGHLSVIAEMSGYLPIETIIYHARLSEEPHAYTWKEYAELISSWNKGDAKDLQNRILSRVKDMQKRPEDVVKECFKAACGKYEKFLSLAADDVLDTSFTKKLAEAEGEIKALRALGVELKYFEGDNPVLNETDFVNLLQTLAKWVHFTNHEAYPAIRAQEKKLLLDIAANASYPERFYEAVRPWSIESFMRNEGENALYSDIGAALEPRVADVAIRLFNQQGGIHSIWPRDKHYGIRRLLLNPEGSVLKVGSKRQLLLETLKSANDNEVVATNAVEFFHMISGTLQGKLDFDPPVIELLKKDHEFILTVWDVATRYPLQPRALGSFMQAQEAVMGTIGVAELPLKKWMEVKKEDVKPDEQASVDTNQSP